MRTLGFAHREGKWLSVWATGIQDLDVGRKMLSKNRLQAGGRSLPCRKHLSVDHDIRDSLRRMRDCLQQGHLLPHC